MWASLPSGSHGSWLSITGSILLPGDARLGAIDARELIDEGYQRAVRVLRECVSEFGFKASALAGGYPQVWARDSAITSLGGLLTGESDLVDAARSSLVTLGKTQTELGMIHLNLDSRSSTVTTENAGAVDANLWYVLGHYAHHQATGDLEFLETHWQSLEAATLWLRYQDMNDCGLLEVPEAGDWADLYAVRYNVLYDNVLFVAALRAMAQLADALGTTPAYDLFGRARAVAERINLLMWLDRPWDGELFGRQLERLKAMRLEWYLLHLNTATMTEAPFYLPWVGFREFGNTFDGLGNSLAILLGVADEDRVAKILRHAHGSGADKPWPLKAFSPAIHPGDRDWRDYYRSRNLNLPDQYHNGGIWPFIGGFYVAALVRAGQPERAREQLLQLATANRLGRSGEWEFNEWLHGVSGRPMGQELQAWSAAMFIFAKHAVDTGKVPWLGALDESATPRVDHTGT